MRHREQAITAAAAPPSALFEWSPFVLSLSVRWVERLLLVDDVDQIRGKDEVDGTVALKILGRHYAAWDLGDLMSKRVKPKVWVLMTLPHKGENVGLALRAPTCVAVTHLQRTFEVNKGMFVARRGALAAAFSPAGLALRVKDIYAGMVLHPPMLWTDPELDLSIATIAKARAEDASRREGAEG